MLRVFTAEIKPSVREVMEDMMEGTYASRPIDAGIWGVAKQSLDYRIYVTDATGRVLFDSAGLAVGQGFSQWRDHVRALTHELKSPVAAIRGGGVVRVVMALHSSHMDVRNTAPGLRVVLVFPAH